MKEKIERFSKGIFEYEQPEMIVSQDVLDVFVSEGEIKTGEFTITNSKGTSMKGVIYSTSPYITIQNNRFIGTRNEIVYTINATYLEQGQRKESLINIVSDCGERQIPVSVSVSGTTCMSHVGRIGNVFQFANLAQTDWNEAVRLFMTREFYEAVIKKDKTCKVPYDVLKKSTDPGSALEEFLCACKKKTECGFFVGTSEVDLEVGNDNLMEKIQISKRTWGWLRLCVSSDVPFLVPQSTVIENEDFINGRYELRVVADMTKAGPGVHRGNIRIFNSGHSVLVPFTLHVGSNDDAGRMNRRHIDGYRAKIVQRYLDFRTDRISNTVFITESVKLTESVLTLIDKELTTKDSHSAELQELKEAFELYRAYLATAGGRHFKNDGFVESALLKRTEYQRKRSRFYPVLLYIEALRARNREINDSNLEQISRFYEEDPSDTLLFWILLYMDRKLGESAEYRYESILAQFGRGCDSPVLTYEAAALVKTHPEYITSADGNECRIVSFMLKYDMITDEVAQQFAYACRKSAPNDELRLRVLIGLFAKFGDNATLEMICRKVISLKKRDKRYHSYFRTAAAAQLNVDGIYEYFIYTMGGELSDDIPQPALLYFGYTPGLDEESLEMLYAYVIRNKEKNKAIYRAYLKNMEQLAVNSLKERKINTHLSTIYADVVSRTLLESDPALVDALPDVLFTCLVTADSEEMKKVVVVNDEEDLETIYDLKDGRADVLLYTESSECYFMDERGNRFSRADRGEITRYLHMIDMLAVCYDMDSANPRLLLYMWAKSRQYHVDEEAYITMQKQISGVPSIKKEIANECDYSLACYYYENYEGELLESYLKGLELTSLNAAQRSHAIELMILRNMYDEVIEAIGLFSVEGVNPKYLSRLCIFGMEKKIASEEVIVSTAHYAFRNSRIDDRLLQFLADRFNGTTLEMYEIWNAAKEANLDTFTLEENLLAQMLFAESYIENAYSVFSSFYFKNRNRKLIRAYISYTAYKYFVRERITNSDFFMILRSDPSLENSQIGILALLKFYSTRDTLTDAEKEFADSHIRHFLQKKMFYAFFKDFKDKIPIPAAMTDKVYVEYRTDPAKQVFIHYTYNEDLDIVAEQMTDVGYGIFTKELILFHGEILQYFITENDGEQEEITESRSLKFLDEDMNDRTTKYDEINDILIAVEMRDDKTAVNLLEQYYRTEYAMKRHFKRL
ncbi:MAG: hypothetical protein IKS11_07885 [Lachnospiraceae bacterium]|nr:hypothetical protein [Lachnospiraceae bacterium]